jgi:hypothetical protein
LSEAVTSLQRKLDNADKEEAKEIIEQPDEVMAIEEVKGVDKEEEPMQIDTSSKAATSAKAKRKLKYEQRLEAAEEMTPTEEQAKALKDLQRKLETKRLAQNSDSFAPIDLDSKAHKTRSTGVMPSAKTSYKDIDVGGGAGELPVPTMTKVINIMK